MRTRHLTVAAVLLILPTGALATGGSQNTAYIAGPSAGGQDIGSWCDAGGHDYLPVGVPGDYGETDLKRDPHGYVQTHTAWALSGEPECSASDLVFGTDDDAGVGKIGVCVAGTYKGRDCGDHRGHDLSASTNDVSGQPHLRIVVETCGEDQPTCDTLDADEEVTGEACGATAIQLPSDIARYWRTPIDEPAYFVWIYVRTVHLDDSSGSICQGATGSMSVDY